MKHSPANPQQDLFENDALHVVSLPTDKTHLASLVEALLLEIAMALAAGDVNRRGTLTPVLPHQRMLPKRFRYNVS